MATFPLKTQFPHSPLFTPNFGNVPLNRSLKFCLQRASTKGFLQKVFFDDRTHVEMTDDNRIKDAGQHSCSASIIRSWFAASRLYNNFQTRYSQK